MLWGAAGRQHRVQSVLQEKLHAWHVAEVCKVSSACASEQERLLAKCFSCPTATWQQNLCVSVHVRTLTCYVVVVPNRRPVQNTCT